MRDSEMVDEQEMTAWPHDAAHFRIIGTAPKMLKIDMAEIPITVIPTIVSEFVVDRPADLYLPVNFYLYDFCKIAVLGDALDARTNIVNRLSAGEPAGRAEAGDERCNKALGAAIADYRRSRVIALP